MPAPRELSEWFTRVARKLPWRQTRDAYKIWISEVMLQQTQVATVIPYYEKFLAAFPTIEALANAPEDAVLTRWSGLGYYSRARNLQRGAQWIVEKHDGTFPRDLDAARAIPGVGPYTAGAVLSIAFDRRTAIVDGNVQRVFSRWYRFEKEIESKDAAKFFWEKAQEWVDAGDSPRILNQALMELGATVCIKGTPRCEQCPISKTCRGKSIAETLPRRKPRREKVDLDWKVLVQECRGRVLLRKNPAGAWWHGLWDFPRIDSVPDGARPLATKKHTVTHHRLHISPFHLVSNRETPAPDSQWFDKNEVPSLALSSLARKVWAATMDSCSDDSASSFSPSPASAPRNRSGSRGSPPANS